MFSKIFIPLVAIYFLTACTSPDQSSGHSQMENEKPHKLARLTVADSIVIPIANKLDFVSSNHDKLLFISGTYDIITTQRDGKILHSFNPLGGGENEIGFSLKQACFNDNQEILIASERGISTYSQEGVRLGKMKKKFPFNAIRKKMHSFSHQDGKYALTETLISSVNSSMSTQEYYNTFRGGMIHNLTQPSSSHILEFPPKSIFRDFQEYFPDLDVDFSIGKQGKYLAAIFNPDLNLYLYKKSNPQNLEKVIPLTPQNFHRSIKIPFTDGKPEIQNLYRVIKCNSRLLRVIVSEGNICYVMYRKGIPLDQSHISFEEANERYQKYLLKIDMAKGVVINEYRLPIEVKVILGILDNDTLLFSSKNEGDGFEVFYTVKAP